MKTYLINLDKEVQRFAAADSQLKRLGIQYERFSAVYAKEMSPQALNSAVNAVRWWCAVGRPVKAGEIGCALSHYAIYKKMLADGIDVACILEDDVILSGQFVHVATWVEKQIDVLKPMVVLLSNHTSERQHDRVLAPAAYDMFTEGYVLTRCAARALLAANYPLRVPCDHWGRWVRMGIIELYHAFPTVCSQVINVETSSISSANDFCVANLPVPLWLLHKCKRALGLVIDSFLLSFEKL